MVLIHDQKVRNIFFAISKLFSHIFAPNPPYHSAAAKCAPKLPHLSMQTDRDQHLLCSKISKSQPCVRLHVRGPSAHVAATKNVSRGQDEPCSRLDLEDEKLCPQRDFLLATSTDRKPPSTVSESYMEASPLCTVCQSNGRFHPVCSVRWRKLLCNL